jgi:alpha-1,2-mannosyltransferase
VIRSVLEALRSGSWLTTERLRVYPIMIGGLLAVALVALVATSHGGKDLWGNILGTDFSGIWVAGREVLAGHPAAPYDNALHAAAQAAAFGPSDGFLTWPYPPYFLVVAAMAASVPYLVALAIWQATTVALYLATVVKAGRGLAARDLIVPALAFPAVAINLVHGHNGFLSAALVGGGALCLRRRPLVAGILFGLLAYKPQFAIAIPVALLAGRHWRAIGGAALTSSLTTGATILLFGLAPWRAFFESLAFTRHVVLEQGGLEPFKLQSVFAGTRLVGGSVPLAYVCQSIVAGGALIALAWLWFGLHDDRLKVAGLILASLVVTPYVVDYDFVMLAPALAALVSLGRERELPAYGKTLLAAAWIMPLLARGTAETLALPIGVLSLLAVYVWIIRVACSDAAAPRQTQQCCAATQ